MMGQHANLVFVLAVLSSPADAQLNVFNDCPPRLQSTGAAVYYVFGTDPGVDYATWCYQHDDEDSVANVKCKADMLSGLAYDTLYVKLPKLTVDGGPAGTGYTWWNQARKVAYPGTLWKNDATSCPKTTDSCIGEDFRFLLPKYDETKQKNEPQIAYNFVAHSPGHTGLDCPIDADTCCLVGIEIIGNSRIFLLYATHTVLLTRP